MISYPIYLPGNKIQTEFFSPKRKKATQWVASSLNNNLAVPYSHMGRPHTTIGATAFHF